MSINRQPVESDYLFSLFDKPTTFGKVATFVHWESNHGLDNVTKIALKPSDIPLIEPIERDGFPCYGWKFFTVSAVCNWCIREGYTDVYLVGVDHDENEKQFTHFDDTISPNKTLHVSHHQGIKMFIYECAMHTNIYQTNPAVRDKWELPFVDIDTLLK